MKYKVILFFLVAFAGQAQLKVGSNPTTLTTNKNLEVEASNGKKINVNKDDGRVFIENKPSASLTDSVVMRYSDGEIRQISMARLGGELSGYQDSDGDGIPNNTDPDDDNDGILDGADKCPLVYGCVGDSTNVATKGCPNNCSNPIPNVNPFEPQAGELNACMSQIMSRNNSLGFNTYKTKKPASQYGSMYGGEIDIAGEWVISVGGVNRGTTGATVGANDSVFIFKGTQLKYKVKDAFDYCAINATHGFTAKGNTINVYDLASTTSVPGQMALTLTGETISAMDASSNGAYLVVLTNSKKAYIFKRNANGVTYAQAGSITTGTVSWQTVQTNDYGDFVCSSRVTTNAGEGATVQAYMNNNDTWSLAVERLQDLSTTNDNDLVRQISLDNNYVIIAESKGAITGGWSIPPTVPFSAFHDDVTYYKRNSNNTLATGVLVRINDDIYNYGSSYTTYQTQWWFNPFIISAIGSATYSLEPSGFNVFNEGNITAFRHARGYLAQSNCYVVFMKSFQTSATYGTIYKWNTTKTSLTPVGGFTYPLNSSAVSFSIDTKTNYMVFGITGGNTYTGSTNYSNVSYMNLACDGGCN